MNIVSEILKSQKKTIEQKGKEVKREEIEESKEKI